MQEHDGVECRGKRYCNRLGWCEGDSMCDPLHPCHVIEYWNPEGHGRCTSDDECRGDRNCDQAVGECTGYSGCPSVR